MCLSLLDGGLVAECFMLGRGGGGWGWMGGCVSECFMYMWGDLVGG